MENRLIGAFSVVLGLSVKIILLHLTASSSDSREHSSHCFQHLLHSPQGPEVFILRSQCLYNHQLTGSACGFQNATYLQNTIMIEQCDWDFIDLEEILYFLPMKNNFTDTK